MIVGCLFAAVVAWFIIVACAATLHSIGQTEIQNAADAAQALRPLAGEYAYLLFAAGLFNASLFAASILPISTAYAVCEGLGFESGLDKKFHEAPAFYWLYTLLIAAGAGVLLVPNVPLAQIMLLSQVVNGVVLPFVLVFMLLLTNDPELMGEHVNSRTFNVIAWLTVGGDDRPDDRDAADARLTVGRTPRPAPRHAQAIPICRRLRSSERRPDLPGSTAPASPTILYWYQYIGYTAFIWAPMYHAAPARRRGGLVRPGRCLRRRSWCSTGSVRSSRRCANLRGIRSRRSD